MRRLILAITAFLLLLAPVRGTSVRYRSFDDLVRDAPRIVLATVTDVASRANPDDPHIPIWTDVRFEKVTAVKGKAGSALTVSHAGGRLGKRTVWIPGMPRLSPGGRYVLFLRDSPGPCPFSGWGQGVFRIDEHENVLTSDGRPIREVKGGRVVVAPPKRQEDEEDVVRLIWPTFKTEIESRVRRQEAEEREARARERERPEPAGEEER